MPKAILEFNLPEEQYEFESAHNGSKFRCVLSELDTFLRNKIKYEDLTGKDSYEELCKTREELHSLLCQFNINLDG